MQRPDTDTLIQHLQDVPIFHGLGTDILAELARAAAWRQFTSGAIVFLEGEPAPGLYYLHAGWLKIVKSSPEGREQTLHFLSPGVLFNYMGMFSDRPNPATAIALEPAGVWLLQSEAVRRVLVAYPEATLRVVETMSERIADLVQMVADLSLHTVEARLARLLLEQAEGEVVKRRRWGTQDEIAARLGTVPDVLSRALRGLVEENLIEVERRQIQILDRAKLSAKAMLET